MIITMGFEWIPMGFEYIYLVNLANWMYNFILAVLYASITDGLLKCDYTTDTLLFESSVMNIRDEWKKWTRTNEQHDNI